MTVVPADLSDKSLFELKRLLILNTDSKPISYPLGPESDFSGTAAKIYIDADILGAFHEAGYKTLPALKPRRWIVVCASNGVYPLYRDHNLEKFQKFKNAEYKVLKLSKQLFRQLHNDIDFNRRIIYTNYDSRAFKRLPDKLKEPKNYALDNITAINRKESMSCCTLM